MSVLARVSMFFQSWQHRSLERALDRALNREDAAAFADASRLALHRPGGIDLLTPGRVADGLALLEEHEDGGGFIRLAAGIAHQPYRLMKVRRGVVKDGLCHAISCGHTGEELEKAVGGFAADPRNHQHIQTALRDGCSTLMADSWLSTHDQAIALNTLAHGHLPTHPFTAEAIHNGVLNGTFKLIHDLRTEELVDLCKELSGFSPVNRKQHHTFHDAICIGTSAALEHTSLTSPHYLAPFITDLQRSPQLAGCIRPEHVATAYSTMLQNPHFYERNIAALRETVSDSPTLQYAIASLPQSQRVVVLGTEETQLGLPLIFESRPRGGIVISDRGHDRTDAMQVAESWVKYGDRYPTLLSHGLPAIFEGVSRLTHSSFPRHAMQASAMLTQLEKKYRDQWEDRLPANSQTRIEKALAARPAAA